MQQNEKNFATFIRMRREALGKSLRGMAADLGIAPPYLSDMENGKRNPPIGELLKKMEKMYCNQNAELQLYFYEIVGFGRNELPPDMVEHLMANIAARSLVRLLMQVDLHPENSSDEEDYYFSIKEAIENIAVKKGVKLTYSE